MIDDVDIVVERGWWFKGWLLSLLVTILTRRGCAHGRFQSLVVGFEQQQRPTTRRNTRSHNHLALLCRVPPAVTSILSSEFVEQIYMSFSD